MPQSAGSRSSVTRRRLLQTGASTLGAASLMGIASPWATAAPFHPGVARLSAQEATVQVSDFTSEVEAKPVKLTLWTFVDTHARWFKAMGASYKAQVNPDFELEVIQTAYEDHHSKLLVSLQSGGVGAPDLADIEQGRFGAFMKLQSGMSDLTDKLKSGGYLDQLVASRESLYTINGQIYGVEHALCPVVFYYRSDLYPNVTPDKPLVSWDDFIAATKELATGDVKGLSLTWDFYDQVLRQRGFDLFDKDGNVTADSPEAIETLEWFFNLRDEHKVAAEPPSGAQASGTAADQAWYGALNEGKYTAVAGADWYAGFLKDNVPDLAGKWSAQYLPVYTDGGSRTSVSGGTGLTLISSSDNQEAAWDFTRYSMLTTEGCVQQYLQIKLWPAFQPAWKDKRLYSKDDYFRGQELGQLFTEVGAEAPAQYQSPYRSDLVQLRTDKYTRKLFDGDVSPADGLKQLSDEIRKSMS